MRISKGKTAKMLMIKIRFLPNPHAIYHGNDRGGDTVVDGEDFFSSTRKKVFEKHLNPSVFFKINIYVILSVRISNFNDAYSR